MPIIHINRVIVSALDDVTLWMDWRKRCWWLEGNWACLVCVPKMTTWTGLWKWNVLGPDFTCTCQLSSRGCLQLWLLWPSGSCSSKRIWRQNSSLVEIYDCDFDRNSWCRKVTGPRREAKDVKKEKWMTGWKNVWKKWMITCFWLRIHTHTRSLSHTHGNYNLRCAPNMTSSQNLFTELKMR